MFRFVETFHHFFAFCLSVFWILLVKHQKAHRSKRNNKAVSENKSLHRFFYPNKQSKTRKERQRFCGTTNYPLQSNAAFTTSYLYPHNAYLSSTPLTQHNSRIKRTFRPQAFRNLCKTPNADDIRPPIPSCPQDMPQCANAYHGENYFRPYPPTGIFCT